MLFLSGCTTLPVAKRSHSSTIGDDRQVCVVSHGWHSGIVIESKEIVDLIPELGERFADSQYLEFGWGDSGFYQANEITTRLTLRAVFWPTDTVVHVVSFDADPVKYFLNSEVLNISMGAGEYDSMLDFISSSFAKNESGNVMPMKNGIYGDSQFYEGVGSYFLFNTCNKWTAKALYSGGVEVSPLLKLTSSSVMKTVREDMELGI
ncbi:MAG: TIGR02117 family protein [Opitutaceae bacterium]